MTKALEVRIPNAATRAALADAKARRDLRKFDTVEQLFDDLEI